MPDAASFAKELNAMIAAFASWPDAISEIMPAKP